jgi:hypothetical protein
MCGRYVLVARMAELTKPAPLQRRWRVAMTPAGRTRVGPAAARRPPGTFQPWLISFYVFRFTSGKREGSAHLGLASFPFLY